MNVPPPAPCQQVRLGPPPRRPRVSFAIVRSTIRTSRFAIALSVGLGLVACSKSPTPGKSAELQPVDMSNHPPLTPLPDPDLQGGHVGRAPRRLTVEQLKASILVTTGRQWSQIDTLAPSLGQADFALINAESTAPNMVFSKFLEDGAREVCLATALADLSVANGADRVLSPKVPATTTDLTQITDAEVRDNLKYLSLRFWGQELQGAELDTWATAFKALAHATQVVVPPATAVAPRQQAWGGICIALMTDPRFFTY